MIPTDDDEAAAALGLIRPERSGGLAWSLIATAVVVLLLGVLFVWAGSSVAHFFGHPFHFNANDLRHPRP
jgi:hypothetical protein